jgi:hypothetical protein
MNLEGGFGMNQIYLQSNIKNCRLLDAPRGVPARFSAAACGEKSYANFAS